MYTLHDLRAFGRKQGWCPYFLARHMMSFANVVVYNYQYMIDPKVSQVTPAVGGVVFGSISHPRLYWPHVSAPCMGQLVSAS